MWLSIILALISFFTAKKSGASNTQALLTAGLVGGGTYWAQNNTEWGAGTLGQLNAAITEQLGPVPFMSDDVTDGAVAVDAAGNPLKRSTNIMDVLRSWGASGTAAVIGTTAVATGGLEKFLPFIIGGAALLLLTR